MYQDTLQFTAVDGHEIFTRIWKDNKNTTEPRAVFHINHGMAEHSARYAALAERLVAEGYVVMAHDHRGHGYSVKNGEILGHYADKKGWHLVLEDVKIINDYIHQTFPDTPVILMGHSMGSFIAQAYMVKYGNTVDAVLLSGSAYHTEFTLSYAKAAAQVEKTRIGGRGRSFLIDALSFGSYNKTFNPTRTNCDWLSRDPEQVDLYVQDPLCGFLCTNQLWLDLVNGIGVISKVKNLRNIPNQIPYLLFSGEDDPMSHDPKESGIHKLQKRLEKAGQHSVTVKLFPQGRHEILNETNRAEVMDQIVQWLEQHVALKPKLNKARKKANTEQKETA
ncbi:MAG: alpha/beta hydrolase [Pseudomonadales bacterium]|nr:alpha/beta hydrolase [Pseudomonadales bacterium]